MKNLLYLAMLIAILGFILLIGCDKQSNNPVQVPPSTSDQDEMISLSKGRFYGSWVHGWGSRTYEGGTLRTIGFEAYTCRNGEVKGEGVLIKKNSDQNLMQELHFYIDCLAVEDNVAIMSGTITYGFDINEEPSYWPGRHFQFKVVDNGRGQNADPDEMTHMANGAPDEDYPPACGEDVEWDLWPIEAGNIIVRP